MLRRSYVTAAGSISILTNATDLKHLQASEDEGKGINNCRALN